MISPELDGYTKQCEITPTAFDQTMPVIYFKFISVSTKFSFQANLLLDEIPYHGYFLFSVFKFRFLCLRCLLFSQQHLLTGQGVRHLKILTCWYINWNTQEPIKERFSSQRGLVKNKHFPSAFSHLLTAINCRQFSLWKMRQINLIRKIQFLKYIQSGELAKSRVSFAMLHLGEQMANGKWPKIKLLQISWKKYTSGQLFI